MRKLALLAGMLIVFAPTALVAAEDGEAKTDEKSGEEKPDEELGIWDHYFPFSLNEDVVEAVDDIMVPTMFINLLPAGGLWGPLVLLDEDGRPKFNNDILMSFLVPALTGLGIYFVGCAAGTVCGIPTGGVGFVCAGIACIGFIPWLWNAPIAALNAWDRAYKDPNAADREKAKKRSKNKKKEDSDSEEKKETKKESKSDAPAKKTTPDKPASGEPYGY